MRAINASVEDTEYGLHNIPDEAIERVLNRIDYQPNGCWDTTYRVRTPGGPQVQWKVDGEVYFMYHWRVLYYLQHGVVPPLYSLRKTCGNERCVNPDHRKPRQP